MNNIPQELKDYNQWVCWRLVTKKDKKIKLPVNPVTGKKASVTDPSTWSDYLTAIEYKHRYSGIGFVFTKNDPFCGIDMDNHINDKLIDWFDSYTEYSQSGKGAHIIIKGKLPGKGRRNKEFEVYDNERYFIMTGDHIKDLLINERQDKLNEFMAHQFPEKVEKTQSLTLNKYVATPETRIYKHHIIQKIQNSKQADKFNALWSGEIDGYGSQSEADLALLGILRFYTRGDQAESFALFAQSGLYRKKWDREDYQLSTWNAIKSGPVLGQVSIPTVSVLKPLVIPEQKPWRSITSAMVRDVIKGTCLETLVEVYESPMIPALPLEISLIKAIVTAGACLSYQKDSNIIADSTRRGAKLAQVRLETAGAQVCNVYALIVGESATGKDVGGLFNNLMLSEHLYIGNAGSAEGLADALAMPDKGNGVISISEFQNWVKEGTWQHKANPFITSAFSDGWFQVQFSKKNKKDEESCRAADYCFPSILANIQPQTMQKYTKEVDIHSGFLSRFIISTPPTVHNRPNSNINMDEQFKKAKDVLKYFTQKEGVFKFPDGYMQKTADMFNAFNAEPRPHYRRLVFEYGPRIAAMLSVTPEYDYALDITTDHIDKAEIIVQWLFKMGEKVLSDVCDDPKDNREYLVKKKVYQFIRDNKETTKRIVHQRVKVNRKTIKSWERDNAIKELSELGIIVEHNNHIKIARIEEEFEE